MRRLLMTLAIAALCQPVAVCRASEPEASSSREYAKCYYVGDLTSIYEHETLDTAMDRLERAVRENRRGNASRTVCNYRTNLSLVVIDTEQGQKQVAAYLRKLRKAKKVLESAGAYAAESSE